MNGKTYKWQNDKVQGGVAVVDIETGAISAIGGGRNVSAANTLNRAVNMTRQIGSTAKPLYDYGPAIEYLNWNTGTIISDSKDTYSDGTAISNWDGGYIGYNTITTHLKVSRNIPALRAFRATTAEDKIKFVIIPTKNAWDAQTVHVNLYSFISFVNFPFFWGGLRFKDLEEESGIKDAIFCHTELFFFEGSTKESAIEAVNKALGTFYL